ncbi:MAG TPA: glycosyltransferase family 39 protein [Solirubrobacterales bacterium]
MEIQEQLRRKLAGEGPSIALLCGLATLVTLHIVWLDRFRFGFLTEWDESGYISIALDNVDALESGGPGSLASTVLDQGVQAPLVPLSAVFTNVIFGTGVDSSLLVGPIFFTVLVLSTYAVGRQLTTPWWAVLAAFCVSSAPVVADFTRLFHFAVPAAALFTSALWALLRSEGLSRRSWAIACGLLLGLMVLARSMTIAYLPGFGVAAALPLLLSRVERRNRAINLALLVGCGGALAALWYAPNLYSVGDYLLNFGYGAESSAFGEQRSPLSPAYWTAELGGLIDDLYLPLSLALAVCLAAAAASSLRRRRSIRLSQETVRRWLTSKAGLTLIVVAAGYLALTSSSNEGTAFALPWVPALVALVVAATSRIRERTLRLGLAGLLATVSVLNASMKSGLVPGVGDPVSASPPLLGTTPLLDGRGVIQGEVSAAGYPAGSPTEPMPDLHRRWLPFAERLATWSVAYAERRGRRPHLAYGFDDLLLSNTRIALGAQLALSQSIDTLFLKPFPEGDSATSYRRQLEESRSNLLATGERGPGGTGIHLTRSRVEKAARSLGFEPVRVFTLPDGRSLIAWWRDVEPPA